MSTRQNPAGGGGQSQALADARGSETGRRKFLGCAVAVVLSAVMFWFGTGLYPLWWLTWIASVPVLLAAARLPGWAAFVVAIVAWAMGGLNQWPYLHGLIGMPWQILILANFGPALVFAAAVIVWRAFVIRGMLVRAAVGFAAVWVCYEFCLQKTSVHSTW